MIDFLKQKWAVVHDKVRTVVYTGIGAILLALIDILASLDWTEKLGPFAAPLAIFIAAGFAWLTKEVRAFFYRDQEQNHPADTPPVGPV